MTENYDATWYDYAEIKTMGSHYTTFVRSFAQLGRMDGEKSPSPALYSKNVRDKIREYLDNHPDFFTKETTEMSFNTDDQYEIDRAVREAIDKPRREAEVALRVGAVNALSPMLEDAEPGTVIRFTRTFNGNKRIFSYAGIKVQDSEDGQPIWYVTGTQNTRSGWYTTEDLLRWMTTGDKLVSDVQVATEFTDVTWVPAVIPTTASDTATPTV